MAQTEEYEKRGTKHVAMQMSTFSRDLLKGFISMNEFSVKLEERNGDKEEIELSLGLSLNGRFGVDPKAKNKLTRSSSIPDFVKPARDEDMACCKVPMAYVPLIRTCSLPTETEEEWRKRKELQTLRRMEAKRKRSEKQRNLKVVREKVRTFVEGSYENGKRVEGSMGTNHIELCAKLAPSSSGIPPIPLSSQGSLGSYGTGSSGISESESQRPQGVNICAEERTQTHAVTEPDSEKKSSLVSGTETAGGSGKNVAEAKETKEISRDRFEEMPCVSTKGDGPNGKRIEGFLYRYKKGEEVKIVCVCHGRFMSPAEFVKHAGGGDVAQPLKHIVINPSFF